MESSTVRVQRFSPLSETKPHFEEFKIPVREGMTVLDSLLYVKNYLDHTLALRFSCRMSSCGACGMRINGRPRLACETQISELRSSKITVQPMDHFPIVRDLVVDLESFFTSHKAMVPHLVRNESSEQDNPTKEYLMKPQELESIIQFTYCIKCGLCTSACPTRALDSSYPGPQALAQAYRYLKDVRDEGSLERVAEVDTQHGVWRCHFAGNCSAVCPKGVDPALGIQLLKRHVMSAKPRRRGSA